MTMRKWLLLLLLLFPSVAHASISHIAGADICAHGANSATTSTVNTSGADTYLAAVVSVNEPAITSSPSQTWVKDKERINGTTGTTTYIFRASGVTTSTTQTFTSTLTSGLQTICVLSFSGVELTSPTDQSSDFSGGGTSQIYDSSITPSEDNELILADTDIATGSVTVIIDSSMSTPLQSALDPGVAYGAGMAYKIQTTATAIRPTWTYSGSTPATGLIMSYKAAAVTPTANSVQKYLYFGQ